MQADSTCIPAFNYCLPDWLPVSSTLILETGQTFGDTQPHLHYAGEIYLLNEAQWASFSKSAMKSLTEKLGKAQKVSFEDVMQVSEAPIAGGIEPFPVSL